MEPVVLEGFDITIERGEVLRLLGQRPETGRDSGERLHEAVHEALSRVGALVSPKGIYTVTAGTELPGSSYFDELERVAFCVCTIGPAVEEEVTALSGRGELLRAVVLDSVGSVAAEATADYMDRRIQGEAAREGLKTSCRASPGYGDWEIREQGAIFELLPTGRIGVRLTPSFMMVPRKSVSFAVHIAKKPIRMRGENSCRNCDITDCPYRLLE
ncbi:MAG: hypothetical protein JSV33_07255 [bacterium]|nr:MAG: hypothetical protein JSV33_07255 [bacterium]